MKEKEAGEYLYVALNIGEQMLYSGAEVRRVEDSIERICRAYGAERVDVLTITSSIVVTMYAAEFGAITQTRRLTGQKIDMCKLDKLNDLSRRICSDKLTVNEIEKRLDAIMDTKQYNFYMQLCVYAAISGSFSAFFGGSIKDVAVAAIIGIVLKCMDSTLHRLDMNALISAMICSFIGGYMAFLAVRSGLGDSVDKINIGNIMLLIPGRALTTSMRDMFGGDTISGALRFMESVILAAVIALGFAVAAGVGGGM